MNMLDILHYKQASIILEPVVTKVVCRKRKQIPGPNYWDSSNLAFFDNIMLDYQV